MRNLFAFIQRKLQNTGDLHYGLATSVANRAGLAHKHRDQVAHCDCDYDRVVCAHQLAEQKIAKRADKKVAENKKIDKTIYKTVSYVVKVGLKVLVVLGLISYVGIDTSAITALIASLGVGVGLAINGTLSNFAGGVLILITRPFKDDDYIQACGYEGTVEDIRICHTRLRTTDNKVVYLPNGKLSTSEVVNFSEKDLRRVDLKFSISYSDDFEKQNHNQKSLRCQRACSQRSRTVRSRIGTKFEQH